MCGRYQLIAEFDQLKPLLKSCAPRGLESNYQKQQLIKPSDPVIVLRNEGKPATSIMVWGFVSEWSLDPFDSKYIRPFNARFETVSEKKLFSASWRHRRCLLPASGFWEKGQLIRRKDFQPFWLGGIWNRWISPDGSELETCCVLTTKPNELVGKLHNRMPVIIPDAFAEDWVSPIKDLLELKQLQSSFSTWDPHDWIAESLAKQVAIQKTLF